MRKFWQKMGLPLLALGLLLCLGATAGSEEDPLVTRGWVRQYIDRQLAPLEQRLTQAEAQIDQLAQGQGLQTVRLWIGRDYLEYGELQVWLDAVPYLSSSGRTMVPLRALGEAVGAEFLWDNASKQVTYRKGGREILLWIGRAEVEVDGQRQAADCAPELVNGRVMVPLRLVTENLGFKLTWNNSEKMATLVYLDPDRS